MKVSVIIVNYNVRYFLEVCLHSVLRAAQGLEAEVIVVDNNSKDGSMAMIAQEYPSVIRIENKENLGFSKANNQGVAIATGEYILFLNPDTVMPEDFLRKTTAYLDAHPTAGALGPRLIDGKGRFAPDSKKSFPTLSVAIFKTTGINKFFPKSPYINKYYAVHIDEWQTAPVEVLSGCCMLVRSKVIAAIGRAFDEDYFMYCEDVDLSFRIQQQGYENIYFPEATLIHYKGESTKKATLSYVRIFNEALITFVRKHYSKKDAGLFILFINVGIVLRAVLGAVKSLFKVLRMPLFDALILLGMLWTMSEFWVRQVKGVKPIPLEHILATFPVYILLWISTLYLNGAYDQPYRALRIVRGMLIGTVMNLAYYGLLGPELRYSRALIILSGLVGSVALLGLHELFYRLGIFRFIPYDQLARKAVIVASPDVYEATDHVLKQVNYAPELEGRISTGDDSIDALGNLESMKPLLYTGSINEVIFCMNGLRYEAMFRKMEECGSAYDYKIHLPGTQSFVGSNSSHTTGDLYTADLRYNLAAFAHQRNKRVVDLLSSLLMILCAPILLFMVEQPALFFSRCMEVLMGRSTWIGYPATEATALLPPIKPAVLPPYNLLEDFTPSVKVQQQLWLEYAQHYGPGTDISLLVKNFRWIGKIS
jgi:GT2 family glycosyltransferase